MCHEVLEEDLIVRIDVILRVEGGGDGLLGDWLFWDYYRRFR